MLVDAGADLMEPDPAGCVALHHLAKSQAGVQHELFTQALKAGIDINSRDNTGATPLHVFFANITYGTLPLTLSTLETAFEANGADIFAVDEEGRGLLHVIVKVDCGDRYMIEDRPKNIRELFGALVERGLDPWLEDKGQMTPLDVAAVCENAEILKLYRRDK